MGTNIKIVLFLYLSIKDYVIKSKVVSSYSPSAECSIDIPYPVIVFDNFDVIYQLQVP